MLDVGIPQCLQSSRRHYQNMKKNSFEKKRLNFKIGMNCTCIADLYQSVGTKTFTCGTQKMVEYW